jgi:hypothetical protein
MLRLQIDEKRYLSDTLADETIVMDMLEGRLFLFETGAAVLWNNLLKGSTKSVLLDEIESRYGHVALKEVDVFLERLMTLGLLSEVNGDEVLPSDVPVNTATDMTPNAQVEQWPNELGELSLTEYDDMTSIITMDPIHDVDPNQGWPFESQK